MKRTELRRTGLKKSRRDRSPSGIAYARYLSDATSCIACGRTADPKSKPRGWHGPWRLERAHLSSGGGRMVRVEDVRAVVILCSLCHRLHVHHGGQIQVVAGESHHDLSDANLLWLKRERDPANWDLDFIASKWIGIPPEPVEPQINHRV